MPSPVEAAESLTQDEFTALITIERLITDARLATAMTITEHAQMNDVYGIVTKLYSDGMLNRKQAKLYFPRTYSLTSYGEEVLNAARCRRMKGIVDVMNAEEEK